MADALITRNLRPAGCAPPGSTELVGSSSVAARLQELVRRSSLLDSGVMIVGERGADVLSLARDLHARSRPAGAPFVAVECAAGDAGTLERVLFGPPAPFPPKDLESASPDSKVAAARGGTLFLQDVVEVSAALQARLARVARDGEVRVDGEAVATGFRMVASAAPSIDGEVRENRFRPDLYRRLAASRIDLPPLRDRLEDVPALAVRLLHEIAASRGLSPRSFMPAALALLSAVSWPGNLAELRGVVERVAGDAPGDAIQVEHVLPALHLDRAAPAFVPVGSLRDARLRFERDYIAAVLQHHGWKMAEAAQTLGIQRPNLYRKARQLGIPLARATE